ncbi:MAG: caspase family protein [Oscillibacter sp.]|nr:caspase family protein [Oscillibacter sp.]
MLKFLITILFLISTAVMSMGSTSQQTVVDTLSAADTPEDSLEVSRDSLILANADESYRQLQLLRVEDAPESDLYPLVYQCYTDNVAALAITEEGSHEYQKCKSVLRDLNRYLEAGAFYYSAQNNSGNLIKFARAYIDIHLMPEFKGESLPRDPNSFPSLVYIAASGAYNGQDFNRAIEYFKLFFTVGGDENLREKVYMYMGQACLKTGNYALAINTMSTAMKLYPENYHLISFGIKACIDGGHAESLQEFLDKAFAMKPDDEQLLNIQAKLYEDEQEYLKALEIYRKLDEMKPNTLSVAQHTALCYYNLGVGYFNNAIMEADSKVTKRLKRQSNDYFSSAIEKLEEVVANDPMSEKYLKALAVSYGCLDEQEKFEELNARIAALGKEPVSSFNMPPLVSYNESNTVNYQRSGNALTASAGNDAPVYSVYAKEFVEKKLAEWTRKGEFEKLDDYTARVNDVTIRSEYNKACREAQDEYLKLYASKLRLNDLTLKPYDAGNEVYLIESSYGPIYLKVPLKDNEAELFKANWAGIHFKAPQYYIANDEVRVASITFVAPYGKSYAYNTTDKLAYELPKVNVDFEAILHAANDDYAESTTTASHNEVKITRLSDVDENIPVANKASRRTIALIISNENYSNVSKVESALHDGETFAKYCQQTLGIPQENIRRFNDATLGSMLRAITQVKNAAKAFDGDCDLIVYYAGHGMPDEKTKDAYLLPVDGDPLTSESCFSLNRFYDELGAVSNGAVMVFLDACFSGAQRDGSMLSEARGVVMKPKETNPRGNMFVLSATSGQETALPYREKNHGLFTYYLLKKLQDSKGDVTLKELSEEVGRNVRRQSTLINNKPQTPQVSTSGNMSDVWQKKKLRN